jgi:transposase
VKCSCSDAYHAFRTLKSQLEIRPMFHWTDKRIKGHVCMCFIAFIFMNFMRNKTNLQYKVLIKTLDNMQFSSVLDNQTKKHFFIRSAINATQQQLTDKLNLNIPPDTTTQVSINQYIR